MGRIKSWALIMTKTYSKKCADTLNHVVLTDAIDDTVVMTLVLRNFDARIIGYRGPRTKPSVAG
jgi:hypothetical protein